VQSLIELFPARLNVCHLVEQLQVNFTLEALGQVVFIEKLRELRRHTVVMLHFRVKSGFHVVVDDPRKLRLQLVHLICHASCSGFHFLFIFAKLCGVLMKIDLGGELEF
jgi:hypothetical protein